MVKYIHDRIIRPAWSSYQSIGDIGRLLYRRPAYHLKKIRHYIVIKLQFKINVRS